jgi:DNA-binding NtrC family response regulator
LAAVLGIVRGHKGVIKVQSDPGRGTTFKVLFPARPRQETRVETSVKSDADWHGYGTVLVVDDEETVRTMARAMLRRMGFTVLTAMDGREGVEVFRRHADEVRLVLLDLTMPQLDGEAAFREIRTIRPNACVLLSSGFNQPEGASGLSQEGLAGFVQKPYRYDQLSSAVRTALEQIDPPAASASESR